VVSDVTGVTGLKIIRAIVNGERDPQVLATMRDARCKASTETVCAALVGNYQPEHIFALTQALALYDFYQARVGECDAEIERALAVLNADRASPASPLPQPKHKTKQPNAVNFDTRPLLYQLTGVDLTQIHGIGPYLALRLIGECGTDLSRWPSAKHFTSWLTLSPGCKISGGKVLSAHTRKTTNRITAYLRLAAVTVGRTNTALGAFYRRLAARIGKAKAVTATARKIAVLFYNAMRFGRPTKPWRRPLRKQVPRARRQAITRARRGVRLHPAGGNAAGYFLGNVGTLLRNYQFMASVLASPFQREVLCKREPMCMVVTIHLDRD
jgi:transposase